MMGKVTFMYDKHQLSILPHKSQWEIANKISLQIILEIKENLSNLSFEFISLRVREFFGWDATNLFVGNSVWAIAKKNLLQIAEKNLILKK